MTIYEIIETRYSVRKYHPDPVPEAVITRLLEAARLAPSAANRQPWQFLVVRSSEYLKLVHEAYPREWFAQAPLVVVVCATPATAWTRNDGADYYRLDVGIAMDHLILAATAEGLGTCWIAAFDRAKLAAALELPPDVEPVIMTPVGYPASTQPEKSRRPLPDLVRYDHW